MIAEILARLDAAGTPFRLVEGAAEMPDAKARPNTAPAAFALIVEQISGDNQRATGRVLQLSEVDFAIVIITDNLSDDQNAAAAQDIEALTAYVRARLIGWQPADAEQPIEHVSGRVLKVRPGTVWFEDRFTTTVYLEGI